VPKEYNDAKFNLGEPVATMLRDFCAANYKCAALEVIRDAVREHIEHRLATEPAMKERYEAARKSRLNLPEKVVRLAMPKD
jgi:hypothetical protein